MARPNDFDAHRHLSATPRVTRAYVPPKPVPLTLHNLWHHRRFAPWRELGGIVVCAMAFLLIAYMWVGAADPRLP